MLSFDIENVNVFYDFIKLLEAYDDQWYRTVCHRQI